MHLKVYMFCDAVTPTRSCQGGQGPPAQHLPGAVQQQQQQQQQELYRCRVTLQNYDAFGIVYEIDAVTPTHSWEGGREPQHGTCSRRSTDGG
jgi:hypothetical protein